MNRLFLTLALMASYSSIHCMSVADKEECIALTRDLQNYTYSVPFENCDPQKDPRDLICQYMSDNMRLIESLVTRMNALITRYPNNALVQNFIPTRNDMQRTLEELTTAEQDEESSESN